MAPHDGCFVKVFLSWQWGNITGFVDSVCGCSLFAGHLTKKEKAASAAITVLVVMSFRFVWVGFRLPCSEVFYLLGCVRVVFLVMFLSLCCCASLSRRALPHLSIPVAARIAEVMVSCPSTVVCQG